MIRHAQMARRWAVRSEAFVGLGAFFHNIVREDTVPSFCGRSFACAGMASCYAGVVMLVLSRKVGESFLIGDTIRVTVVRITGAGVRIGIEAPAEYTVVRKELLGLVESSVQDTDPSADR